LYQVYGISNCDKVKSFLSELKKNSINFTFFDFKKESPSIDLISKWEKFLGEPPVNKRGTTFRKFKDDYLVSNAKDKRLLLQKNPSAILRPIIEKNNKVLAIKPSNEFIAKLD